MSTGLTKTVDIGKKSIDDYIFEIIVSFQEGIDTVIIRGYGAHISKAVDIYNELYSRLGDSIELLNVEIGSERRGGRVKPFIAIHVKRKY
ncbi:MAG: DNA-binding protein [Thermoprotei archaeon]|nr:MAG: DNA-binding protein [Thermoprotei archaeon]